MIEQHGAFALEASHSLSRGYEHRRSLGAPARPLSPMATGAVKLLLNRGDSIYVASQSLIEFWNVATRPISANGLGMTPAGAAKELDQIEALFPILPDIPSIVELFKMTRVVGPPGGRSRSERAARAGSQSAAGNERHTWRNLGGRRPTQPWPSSGKQSILFNERCDARNDPSRHGACFPFEACRRARRPFRARTPVCA